MVTVPINRDLFPEDFECPCCKSGGITPHLRHCLESLRYKIKAPLLIHSAYRCNDHNSKVGGVPASYHILGSAVDLSFEGVTLRALYVAAQTIPAFANGGIGLYFAPDRLHLDNRRHAARWAKLHDQRMPWKDALHFLNNQDPDQCPQLPPAA